MLVLGPFSRLLGGKLPNDNVSTNNDNSNAVTLASDLAKQSKSDPLSWLGPVGSLVGSALGFAGGLFTNKANYDIMKEQWHREDTAYQRAVADMKKAGLNPNLVSSGGAGAGSVVSMQNPLANFGGDVSQAFNDYLDSIGTKISLDNSQALNLLRYAKLEAQEILNTYSPETARVKLLKLKEELEALGFQNDVKEIQFVIDNIAKFMPRRNINRSTIKSTSKSDNVNRNFNRSTINSTSDSTIRFEKAQRR